MYVLVNGRRVGYTPWATAPDGSIYFPVASVMPVLRDVRHLRVGTASDGMLTWTLTARSS